MKQLAAISVACIMIGAPLSSLAVEGMLEIEERCRSYALEDNILDADMEEYLQECIETLTITSPEEEGESTDVETDTQRSE